MIAKTKTKLERRLENILDIQKTPDPHRYRKYTPRTHATNPQLAGVGVCSFLSQLFVLNEQLPTSKKLTDAEIARQVRTNYPDSKAATNFVSGKRTVQYYRCLYNTGILTPRNELATAGGVYSLTGAPLPPLKPSKRYDQYGRVVTRRGGPKQPDPDPKPKPLPQPPRKKFKPQPAP